MHTMPKPLGGAKPEHEQSFARKSSGLVRAASTTDANWRHPDQGCAAIALVRVS